MVPKLIKMFPEDEESFRAVLFRMVPKPEQSRITQAGGFRAVLFRMVPKHFN